MKSPPSFEQSFDRLEEIVKQLESGALTLEQSLCLFEEATSCARQCDELLNRAEAAIKLVTSDAQGNLSEELFRGDDEPDQP